MGFKKRRKHSRQRGLSTYGKGARQGTRGSGNKGGVGMSGTGKKAGQKKQFGLRYALKHGVESYFGRRGFTSRSTKKKISNVINLEDIKKKYDISKKIELKEYKILGEGEGFKGTIFAASASEQAKEKMEKAGGEIIVEEKKERIQTQIEKENSEKVGRERKSTKEKVSKKK
jgi:large subunit ribosomal protein L15